MIRYKTTILLQIQPGEEKHHPHSTKLKSNLEYFPTAHTPRPGVGDPRQIFSSEPAALKGKNHSQPKRRPKVTIIQMERGEKQHKQKPQPQQETAGSDRKSNP